MVSITQTLILRVLFVFFLSLKFQTILVQPRSLLTTEEDLAFAKNYLEAFGYLAKKNDSSLLESATRKFQEFYNLKVSGKLDDETMKTMSKPRCGLRDVDYPGPKQRTWPPNKRHLTYSIRSYVNDDEVIMSVDVLRPVFKLAFPQWSQVSNFTFEEAAFGASSDIVIGVYRGYHGDCCPFDGPGHVLAHSFFPTDGRLHYDGDDQWSLQVPPEPETANDLVWVGIHEIGHLLGLVHSNDTNAIMFPLVEPGKIRGLWVLTILEP